MKEISDDTATRIVKAATGPLLRTQNWVIFGVFAILGTAITYAITDSRSGGARDSRINAIDRRVDDNKEETQQDIRELKQGQSAMRQGQSEMRQLLIKALPDK